MAIDPEWLEVNGVSLSSKAWRIADLGPLLGDADLKGSDEDDLWRTTGSRARPRYRAKTVYSFTIRIFGAFDPDGNPNTDPLQGLIDNAEYLKANLGAASTVDDGTVVAVWHRPDGTTRVADVHVSGPHDVQKAVFDKAEGTLTLSCPGGVFA